MATPPGLFIIKEDNSLVGLSEQQYETEDFLQNLLARYPDLLAGDQINPELPRRWLLITRELGVPDEVEGANRWSLDHLFVDQEGVPTLVEVKRSTDTRIRREVIGQMLDYAANGILHWPIETIRSAFLKQCEQDLKNPDLELQGFIGPDISAETFWMSVKTNLQAGRVRLLFVADIVPIELRRVVEFLNNQMEAAEVLAIEVRQYVGSGLRSLVPRVFGHTAQSEQRKSAGSPRGVQWNEASFFAKLAEYKNPDATRVARKLFEWAHERMQIDFGNGSKYASFIPFYGTGDKWFGPFRCFTGEQGGNVEIPLAGSGMQVPPFNDPERKLEVVRRLNAIPGVQIAEDLTKFPNIGLTVLSTGDRLEKFLNVIDWTLTLVKNEGLK
jgi:hypothetical protein